MCGNYGEGLVFWFFREVLGVWVVCVFVWVIFGSVVCDFYE